MAEAALSEEPEKPSPSDCCNSGCSPCIMDVYEDLMKKWEEKCKHLTSGERMMAVHSSEHVSLLSQTKYSPFQLVSVKQISSDTSLYRFQAVKNVTEETGQEVFSELKCNLNLKPSEHLILQGNDFATGGDKKFTRAYTPVSDVSLSLKGCFDTVIKLYPEGKMSRYIETLSPGDITYWRGPHGGFYYRPNSCSHVLMLCAGTGIAPLYSLAYSIVNNEDDDTVIKMFFCCKDEANILLRKEIHTLQSFWNFSVDVYMPHSSPTDLKPLYGETLKTGRLDKNAIMAELNSRKHSQIMVFICGGRVFCEEMETWVKECGVNSDKIHIF